MFSCVQKICCRKMIGLDINFILRYDITGGILYFRTFNFILRYDITGGILYFRTFNSIFCLDKILANVYNMKLQKVFRKNSSYVQHLSSSCVVERNSSLEPIT